MIKIEVRAAYEDQLGASSREATFEDGTRSVTILKWSPSQTLGGVHLYLTLGASLVTSGSAGHRLEFYIGLDEARDDIAGALAEVAAEPIRAGQPLDEGQTITLPAPLWKGSPFQTLLVFRSGAPVIPDTVLSDGTHLAMRGLAPLHPYELQVKRQIGYDRLWAQFAAKQVQLSDPNRPPITFDER